MLHTVNAEHCPRKRRVSLAEDLLPMPRVTVPPMPCLHKLCFLWCECKALQSTGNWSRCGTAVSLAPDPHPTLLQLLPFSCPIYHSLILGVTSPTGFRYVSSIFLARVAAYSSRCRTSPALPGEPPGARCPRAAHKSPVSGASSAEPAHRRF